MSDFRISKRTPKRMLAITATLTVAFLAFLTWTLVLVLSPSSSSGNYQSNTSSGGGNPQQTNTIIGSPSSSNGLWEAISAIAAVGTATGAVISGIAALKSRPASVAIGPYQPPITRQQS